MLGEGARRLGAEGDGEVLAAARVDVTDGRGEAELRVLGPHEAHRVCPGVVRQTEGQGPRLVHVTVTEAYQVRLRSWEV